MALGGREGETSGLIGVDLARDLVGGVHVDQVGHSIVGFLGDDLNCVIVGKVCGWFECRVGGALALSCLVHVSLGFGIVDGDVSASFFCSWARKPF